MTDRDPRYRDLLADVVARRLWTAVAVSLAGDFIGQGALLLLAYERTGGNVLGPAALFAVQALPGLLSGMLAGSWLDRVPRGRALIALQLLGAATLVAPLLLPGYAPVLGAAAVLGALRAASVSVRSAAVAEGVPEHLRGPLLAAFGTTDQLAQVLGYLTGATVAVTVGAGPALIADAATFLVAAAVLTATPLATAVQRDRRPSPIAGLQTILRDPVLRISATAVWLTTMVTALPEVLAAGAADGAWLPFVLAAAPAGQALTMIALGRRRDIARPAFHAVHLAWFALAFGVAALGNGPAWYVAGNLLIGSGVAWLVGPQTLFVRVAPTHRMAAVTGTMIAGCIAGEGVGSLLFAALADVTSVATAYRAAGFLVLAVAIGARIALDRSPAVADLDRSLA